MTEPATESQPADKQPIVTYVLVGADHDDALTDTVKGYANNKNVVVLRASDYPNLEDAINQIKGPANLIVACHGQGYENDDGSVEATGSFTWETAGEIGPKYSELFSKLEKKGIGTVTVLSCYGGSALEMLKDVPAGTIVQSLTSSMAENNALFSENFQEETRDVTDPTALILEALDNVDPKFYEAANIGPASEVLPTMIGIGGHPPIEINLETLSQQLNIDGRHDRHDLKDAIKLVKQHFDVEPLTLGTNLLFEKAGIDLKKFDLNDPQSLGDLNKRICTELKKIFPDDAQKITEDNYNTYLDKFAQSHLKAAEHELDKKIEQVADKMKNGEPIALDKDGNPDFDELRIRRALGIAYLKTSGELDKMVEQAKQTGNQEQQNKTIEAEHANASSQQQTQQASHAELVQEKTFADVLAKYGLSKDDFANVALHPDTAAHTPAKQPSQGQGHSV